MSRSVKIVDHLILMFVFLAAHSLSAGSIRDEKLRIRTVSLDPEGLYQNGQGPERTVDGDRESIFHTPWSGVAPETSISLTYELETGTERVDYIALVPRQSGSNGIIKAGELHFRRSGAEDFEHVTDFEFSRSNQTQYIELPEPLPNPRSVRIIVTDAHSRDDRYYVSLAQFEAYESFSLGDHPDYDLFTDRTFSSLKEGVSRSDLASMRNRVLRTIGVDLLDGTHDTEYRIQDYEAYRDPHDLAQELQTGAYSQFENPTGIYFEEGEKVLVFVGETHGNSISLRVRDFGRSGEDNTYRLRNGINLLVMRGGGNGYFNYYLLDDAYKTAPSIRVHIARGGQVNGVFDIGRHTNADGARLLENAVSPIMDIYGEYVQLAFTVESLKAHSRDNLGDLLEIYDSIVEDQFKIMGLFAHERVPRNRPFGRAVWRGYMFRDGLGAGFHENTMRSLAHHQRLKRSSWGPAHEFGHINQTRPGLMWVGTTEVTNNKFSAYTQWRLTPDNLRLEHERIGGEIGGRFNAYLNNAHIENQEWGLQGGPDSAYGERNGSWGGDHFVKLVPLWQLTLFFHMAGEGNEWHRPYFWGDVYEAVRNSDDSGVPHGQLQVDFVKHVCDAVGYDLTDFFVRIGMLQEVDKHFSDYSSRQKTITSEMIGEAIVHASQYPKHPLNDTLHFISGNSYRAYRDQLSLEGATGEGVERINGGYRVDHSVWRNATVFETHGENELIRLTMAGTGSPHPRNFTEVAFPARATHIVAVGYDGSRKVVVRRP